MNRLYKCPNDHYILLDIPAPLPVIKLPAETVSTPETCGKCKFYEAETAYLPQTQGTYLLCACEWEHCECRTLTGPQPAPEPEQPCTKKVANPEPQPEPELPPAEPDQPARQPRSDAWTDTEDRAVCIAKRGEVALEYYRQKFPSSDRSDKAVLNRWSKLLRAGGSLACGAKARIIREGHGDQGKTGYIKNHNPERTMALIETEDHANTWFDLTDLEGVNL